MRKTIRKKVYTTKSKYKVCAVCSSDLSSMKVSVDVYLLSPKGEMSCPHSIGRKKVLLGKNTFDFLFDYECGITAEEVFAIQEMIQNMVDEKKENMEIKKSKATVKEMYLAIQEYVRNNQEKLEDNPEAAVYWKDGYGYILTTQFQDFLNTYEELGCKRNEILNCLKLKEVLKAGNGRAYDVQISRNGKKLRFFKIRMKKQTCQKKTEVER